MIVDLTDPEVPKSLAHIWRMLHCQSYCSYVGGWLSEWSADVGYCLDRYSLVDRED